MEFIQCITPSIETLARMQLIITGVKEGDDSLAVLYDEPAEIARNNKLESLEIENRLTEGWRLSDR